VLTGGLEDVQRPDNNDLRAKARLFLASGRQNRCKVDNRVASLRGIDHTIAISDVARAPVDVLGILSGDAADNAPVFVDIKHPDVVAPVSDRRIIHAPTNPEPPVTRIFMAFLFDRRGAEVSASIVSFTHKPPDPSVSPSKPDQIASPMLRLRASRGTKQHRPGG